MESGTLDDELLTALQQLGRLMASRRVAETIASSADADLSQQGVRLVRTLLRTGRVPVAELAARSDMDVAAVSRQLKVLEAAGLVRRAASPTDGRVVLVELTAAGTRIGSRVREVGLRHLEDSLRDWTGTDRRRITRLLSRLVVDLQRTGFRPDRRHDPNRSDT